MCSTPDPCPPLGPLCLLAKGTRQGSEKRPCIAHSPLESLPLPALSLLPYFHTFNLIPKECLFTIFHYNHNACLFWKCKICRKVEKKVLKITLNPSLETFVIVWCFFLVTFMIIGFVFHLFYIVVTTLIIGLLYTVFNT